MNPIIQAIYRYPVKGLSPEPVSGAALTAGAYFPGDRLYAIENGPSGFDAAAPEHQPKIKFLMLMRNERLAALETRYDDATRSLTIRENGREAVRADLAAKDGRLALETFFRKFMPKELRGPPKVLAAPDGFRFTDSRRGFVSIINLASVAAVENLTGRPVDPLRFRGNVYVEGWPAWREFDLVGKTISLGDARLQITKRIVRCAATNVEPQTGIRDLNIPDTLMHAFGHADCGVYAEVIGSGRIAPGDSLIELEPTLPV